MQRRAMTSSGRLSGSSRSRSAGTGRLYLLTRENFSTRAGVGEHSETPHMGSEVGRRLRPPNLVATGAAAISVPAGARIVEMAGAPWLMRRRGSWPAPPSPHARVSPTYFCSPDCLPCSLLHAGYLLPHVNRSGMVASLPQMKRSVSGRGRRSVRDGGRTRASARPPRGAW